ncbi:MAG: tRNA uridine-5-carboxymethylaminomethyl(34) synthesis GTPase MnmE [Alphaproteobacteria bacterium]
MISHEDTIFAIATAPGRGGVQVFRLSGGGAGQALSALGAAQALKQPRKAVLASLSDPASDEVIDKGLVLWFPGPASFTGEDVAELHLHGGRAVAEAMTSALSALPGLRLAEPGEFSRRAFEHGKMDLTEAEAVADLVDAETAAQRRQALRQMDGALGQLYHGWADRLTRALAHIEADLDFPDEDLPDGVVPTVMPLINDVTTAMRDHLSDNQRGERLRSGFSVALIGPPNAGKSSLLNALAARDAAIVSEQAGTTRDVIEVAMDLGGWPVTLADTAGLRDAADQIEDEGVRRAKARAEQADLKLAVFDSRDWPDLDADVLKLLDQDTLVIFNKSDLAQVTDKQIGDVPALAISAQTGEGLQTLTKRLSVEIERRFAPSETPSLTRARHRAALTEALEHLERLPQAPLPELAAEDCRLALRALGRITGRVDVEDLLDVIFRDFCIGK